eukprot:m.354191 g.354191  ORF g.354191 m.354191 type:complete len:50 (+) comp16947_c0_seq1:1871-2020(+)
MGEISQHAKDVHDGWLGVSELCKSTASCSWLVSVGGLDFQRVACVPGRR